MSPIIAPLATHSYCCRWQDRRAESRVTCPGPRVPDADGPRPARDLFTSEERQHLIQFSMSPGLKYHRKDESSGKWGIKLSNNFSSEILWYNTKLHSTLFTFFLFANYVNIIWNKTIYIDRFNKKRQTFLQEKYWAQMQLNLIKVFIPFFSFLMLTDDRVCLRLHKLYK